MPTFPFQPRSSRFYAFVALVLALSVGLSASTAQAKIVRPVSWSLQRDANAGATITFSWRAPHLTHNDHLVVQRREGTARFWRTLVKLPLGSSGSGLIPGLPLGVYELRIAVLGAHRQVLAEQVSKLNVFGDVPFSTLFGPNLDNSAVVGGNGNTGPGTASTPTQTFQYVFGGVGGLDNPEVKITNNHCQSVHFEFLPTITNSTGAYAGDSGSMTVVQESLDPASATAGFNSVSSLETRLIPGPGMGHEHGRYLRRR